VIIALLALLAGAPVHAAATEVRVFVDVPYSAQAEGVLDAYLPSSTTTARLILYIHGGGWTGGDKAEFPQALVAELVGRRGYAVVSMNYRLVKNGQNRFPAQIDDVRAALDFLAANAATYGVSAAPVALMGGSAGGHLAMLYAYAYDPEKRVSAVVDFWGPTDLADEVARLDPTADATAGNFLGDGDPRAAIATEASPLRRVSAATAAPTLLIHGALDPLVPVSQAIKMHEKLLSLGADSQLEIYPDQRHGVDGAKRVDAFGKMLLWLSTRFPPTIP
jgi:acetyl esterase/lipase